jgi:hypothetical protein
MHQKMDPVVKKKWLAALRSGEYEQGKNYLENAGKFCCLGVLCDLAVKEGVIQKSPSKDNEQLICYPDEVKYFGYAHNVLPNKVKEWSKILTDDGEYHSENINFLLSNLNDSGKTFEQIAKYIEDYF